MNIKAHLRMRMTVAGVVLSTLLGVCDPSSAAPPGYVDASTFGYSSTDATAALQNAIDTGQNVYIPNMGTPWYVTPITLSNSNQEILFQSGVVVTAKEGAFLNNDDSLFTASNVSNVKMIGYGATLQMRKSDYTLPPYVPGEWRMGINIGTVSNFQIEGLAIKDTGGDGIYVGASQGAYSQDVLIKDVVLDNNYRQGISVISARNLTIDNAVIINTNGTAPQAGIDFEPNYSDQVLQNITVKNSIINTNGSHGILFATGNMADPSQADATIQNVTIDGNMGSGIKIYIPQPGVTVKNSLFMGNENSGVEGPPASLDLIVGDTPKNSIDYSVFWANVDGPANGWVTLGAGSRADVQPLFYSTDPASPWFMYLDPAISSLIAQGADDGGYMGARPLYGTVPEPTTIAVAGVAVIFLLGGRRRKSGIPSHQLML
jgi:hypothetical protein